MKAGGRKYLVLTVLLLSSGGLRAVAQPFTYDFIETELVGVSHGDVAWLDFDADGDLDAVVTGNSQRLSLVERHLRWYRNDGDRLRILSEEDGTTIPRTDYSPVGSVTGGNAPWLSDLAVGDVNGDGIPDVATVGTNSIGAPFAPSFSLLVGNGSGFDAAGGPASAAASDASLSWADYDNDGDADLLVSGATTLQDQFLSTLLRNDDGVLVAVPTSLPGIGSGETAWADYDGDGDLDLAITGRTTAGPFSTAILRNDNNGVFTDIDARLEGLAYGSVDWGDYDQDGDPDLLVAGGRLGPFFLSGVTRVYANTGGTFAAVAADLGGVVLGAARWGDYDNDGDLDILEAGAAAAVGDRTGSVYSNDPEGFVLKAKLGSTAASSVAFADYDGDKDLDILVAGVDGAGSPVVIQYRNTRRIPNNPPSPPSGLTASRQDDAVTFSWAASSDAETAAGGLTYSLRVGTSPVSHDIMSATATADGRRFVAGTGNAGQNTSWTLSSLPDGNYHWSVQAIDNSYAGSAFAEEMSFRLEKGVLADIQSEVSGPELPGTYSLRQNFPNPFNPSTTITFDLPNPGPVRLELFDVLGRKALTLVDGEWAGGTHSVHLTADGLSSGVYVYRLESGDFSAVRRLTVFK